MSRDDWAYIPGSGSIPRDLYTCHWRECEDKIGRLMNLDMARDEQGRLVVKSNRITVLETLAALVNDLPDDTLSMLIAPNGRP